MNAVIEELKHGITAIAAKVRRYQRRVELFYAGAAVVTNRLGVKIDKAAWRKEPKWKIKILLNLDIGKDWKENIALE